MTVVRGRRLALLALVAAAGTGCGGSGVTDTPKVSTISLSPDSATVRTGSTLPLTVTLRDAAGQPVRATVFWSTSDNTVAMVSTAGVVTARAPGAAKIAATVLGVSATASIRVANRDVATVQVTPAAVSVLVGATTPLEARTLDSEGGALTGRTITWSTDNSSVATVNAQGVVTGVSAGSATITATSEGRSGAAVITVLAVPIATVNVTPAFETIIAGETRLLSATALDADGGTLTGRLFTWRTDNAQVATVSSTGLVTAVNPGTTTITATSEGRSGSASITVRQRPVAAVTLTPSSGSVIAGETLQLTSRTTDAQGNLLVGRVVTFSTSDASRATVDQTGLVRGVAPGNATITATSEGQSATATIRVDPVPVAVVQVSPPTGNIQTGETLQLEAVARSGTGALLSGRTVNWRSGAPLVATVSATGLVSAQAAGTAVIIADVEGVTGSSTVTVRIPSVASVTVTPPTATISVSGSVQLAATLRDSRGNLLSDRSITWSSSDDDVAFVTSSGSVIAFRTGTVTITARSEGVSGTATITVR
jgi:trimeric autotransporter adhesin